MHETSRQDCWPDFVDLLLDTVFLVDAGGRIVYANAACERMFGYRPEELVGQRLLGEYGDGLGPFALAETIWLDLLALRLPAWVLVLSPYLAIQLARGVRRIWRRKV